MRREAGRKEAENRKELPQPLLLLMLVLVLVLEEEWCCTT
eukprot:COSAG06_NODE_632_length_13608_cov_26.746613_7_plen_40_part_00